VSDLDADILYNLTLEDFPMTPLKIWSKPQLQVSLIKTAQAFGRVGTDSGSTHHS
jgi:hypothetical protein